jgi:F420-dependent oxidoreductase-like protein
MKLRIFTEPQQGASYEQLLAVARVTEEEGFDAFFRSDHYLKMGDISGLPGSSDAWLTLAGLARETSRIRLGTLLTAGTFRLPGPLAISVAQVDAMSGGRVELGLGAGWFLEEHEAYGIPFPSLAERFERLEEQFEIITGLWSTRVGEAFNFSGKHYSLSESPALPKPVQSPRPPLIVGGFGAKKTPRLAARFADEFNVPFGSIEDSKKMFQLVDEACFAIDRDPASIERSVALVVCLGEDRDVVRRRAAKIGRDADELSVNGLAGAPDQVIEKIHAYAELGISRLYLQILDLDDLDHLRLIASEVMPAMN